MIPTAVIYGLSCTAVWIIWAFCIGVLFLCEYLPGRTNRKLFTKNKGVFAAIAIMCVLFAISLRTYFGYKNDPAWFINHTVSLIQTDFAAHLVMFLPPIAVSLGVNIGNMIYKVRKRRSEKIKRLTAVKRNNILRFK